MKPLAKTPGKKYGIIGARDMTAHIFNSKMQPILDVLDDPNAEFLISDEPGCSTLALLYFIKRRYRKVTVYHMGEKPRDVTITKIFKTVPGFTSYTEINEVLKEKCTILNL